MKCYTYHSIRVCLPLLILSTTAPAASQTPGPRDYNAIQRVPRQELDAWLKREIARSSGQFDQDRYHFILGFSTGHYGSDPVQAIATRRLAFSLLNNSLAAGDQVTPVAWEMSIWQKGATVALTSDPKSRESFVNAVPYAPAQNSQGGHDLERVMYEVLSDGQLVPHPESAVLLLFTNSNQSQSPTGSRTPLFGANNELLAGALRSHGFRAPVRQSFTADADHGSVTIELTGVFPEKLVSLRDVSRGPRFPTFAAASWQPAADRPAAAEPLPNPSQMDRNPRESRRQEHQESATNPEVIGAILVGLGLLAAYGLWRWLWGRKPSASGDRSKVPAGKPLPGKVTVRLGRAPNDRRQELKSLTTASRWQLVRGEDGTLGFVDETPAKPGTPRAPALATLAFDKERRLRLAAEGDTFFKGVVGGDRSASDQKQIVVGLGDQVLGDLACSTSTAAPERVELRYQKDKP